MSAVEQEAKIKDLSSKLAVFENPSHTRQMSTQSSGVVETQEEEESSSDDDESSNSESEEE